MPETKKLRVLIVEDNRDDAELMKRALCGKSDSIFQCEIVGLFKTCLEVCEANAPDYVILDLCLPDAFGFEGLMRLHEDFPKIPVMVATGRDSSQDAARAVEEYGAIAYIVKPMDMDIFYRAVLDAIVRTKFRRKMDWKIKKIAIVTGILSALAALIATVNELVKLLE